MSTTDGLVRAATVTKQAGPQSRRPLLLWFCVVWLGAIVLLAVLADVLPLASPSDTLNGPPRSGPSAHNWLGTDALGRDVLSRVAYGARVSLTVGLGSTALATVLGGAIGLVAGYGRGWVDSILTPLMDAALAFPSLVAALVVVTFLGPSLLNVLLVLGVLSAPAAARVVRGSTLAVRDHEFVTASRALGARPVRTILREVIPNIIRTSLSFAFLSVGIVIVAEGSMAFLGLSVRPPTPTWGGMIEEGRVSLDTNPWATLAPAVIMILTVLALNLFHDLCIAPSAGPGTRARTRSAPTVDSLAGVAESPSGSGAVPDTKDAALVLSGMRTTFATPAGPLQAVSGVTLRVGRGRTVGIVGESGSGKSVLIRSFLRVLDGAVAERGGRAWFGDTEVTELSDQEFAHLTRSRIGVVFQDTASALNPVRTIGSQLREVVRLHLGVDRRASYDRALALLRDVRISDPGRRMKQYPHQLSGGMRQRVLIAMALAGDPELLLADEPTTALDVTVQRQVLQLLCDQSEARGAALLLVSHDLPLIAHWAHDVIVMYRGQVVESGPAADVLARPRMPYTRALLDAVPDPFDSSESRLAVLAGQPAPTVGEVSGCAFASRCPRAQERCRVDSPQLTTTTDPGSRHQFACWFPLADEQVDGSNHEWAGMPMLHSVEKGRQDHGG